MATNEAFHKDQNQKDIGQYLTFVLQEEEYGVHILKVRGIQGWQKTTPIPNVPDYVLGVINLRGEVVPIIDLRMRFGLESVPYTAETVVIIVKVGPAHSERTVGLVVDAVADVQNINPEEMKNKPDLGGSINDDFVKGLAMIDEKMIILLEIDNLVNWNKLIDRQQDGEAEKQLAEEDA